MQGVQDVESVSSKCSYKVQVFSNMNVTSLIKPTSAFPMFNSEFLKNKN